MVHIYKCLECNEYTLKTICKRCKKPTIKAAPPKYSPQDRYGRYRREMKKLLEKR